MADSPEERAHWRSVLKAFDGYMQYHLSANHSRRMSFFALPKDQKALYEQIGYREKLDAVDEGIRRNAEFIDEMIADPVFADMLAEPSTSDHAHAHSHAHSHSHTHAHSRGEETPKPSKHELDQAQDKVRSTLRSFVRDWSDEGSAERQACYAPCLEALEKHYPKDAGKGKAREKVEVLVPGCGLGRLAMEIAAKGFASQGNEFSTYMLLGSHFVLNQTTQPYSHAIHPYLHSFSNHPSTSDHLLRRVRIPDVCPAHILGQGTGGPFSLVAGDFEEIYGEASWDVGSEDGEEEGGRREQKGRWGAVVTCFFIDCARNVLNYLRIIHTLLADDGVWINIGPLLWHFENSPTKSATGEGSVELSLDEVKELARLVGFELREEKMVRTTYTGIPEGMLRHEYNAAFWTATKRAAPT